MAALSAPAALALSSCSDPERGADAGRTGPRGDASAADLDALEFAAGLELSLLGAYRQTTSAMSTGSLGEVPAAIGELVRTAASQHDQCLEAINALLEDNERPAVSQPNRELETTVINPVLSGTPSWADVANLVRSLETSLAATYLRLIQSTLRSTPALRLAAGIQCTGQKRVAVLNFILGTYPVPDAFQKTDAAISR